jgi:hypothetical protein
MGIREMRKVETRNNFWGHVDGENRDVRELEILGDRNESKDEVITSMMLTTRILKSTYMSQ